jgi:hypothetical protein
MPFVVPIIESEKGWGQKVDDHIYFRDGDKAHEYKRDYNQKHLGKEARTPDIYWFAETPYHIDADKLPKDVKFQDD